MNHYDTILIMLIGYIKMPINVFGNSPKISENKIDISLFKHKLYLRSNYIESNIEEDIDLKNQFKFKNLPNPISTREPVSTLYVDKNVNHPSRRKKTAHGNFNDKNLDNVRLGKVNTMPAIGEFLTAKFYVDQTISSGVGEVSSVRDNQDNDFNSFNPSTINSISLRNQAVKDNRVIMKSYVDQFHGKNGQSRRDVGVDFHEELNDLMKDKQDNTFYDIKLNNFNSDTVNRNPTVDIELANKKYVDDELHKITLARFSLTLEIYLKLSVVNDINNLTKYDKTHIADITEIT